MEEREEVSQPRLTIELVPATCWFSNVRSALPGHWDLIRRSAYQKAGYVCEVCGGKGSRHPVECHEVWRYDDENLRQVLTGMVALCPPCHEVKHIGLATKRGRRREALEHLARINGWSHERASEYVQECFEEWQLRSLDEWSVDFSVLREYGVAEEALVGVGR